MQFTLYAFMYFKLVLRVTNNINSQLASLKVTKILIHKIIYKKMFYSTKDFNDI